MKVTNFFAVMCLIFLTLGFISLILQDMTVKQTVAFFALMLFSQHAMYWFYNYEKK